MPRSVALGGVVLLTSALVIHAEPPPCPPTAPEGCRIEQRRPVQRTILNACLTETRCVREETEKKGYTVQTRDVETEVPYTRQVPVTITDPCTGQKRTEMRTETVMQKATTTYIVILPPECPATTTKKGGAKEVHAPDQGGTPAGRDRGKGPGALRQEMPLSRACGARGTARERVGSYNGPHSLSRAACESLPASPAYPKRFC